MRYIDSWLSGLGLEYIIPKLKANGITTPKKLAMLSLRDMYEVGKSQARYDTLGQMSAFFSFDLFVRVVSFHLLNRFCRNNACFGQPVTVLSSRNVSKDLLPLVVFCIVFLIKNHIKPSVIFFTY